MGIKAAVKNNAFLSRLAYRYINRKVAKEQYRCNKDEINVAEIASIYGGGGHVKASGAPMDNSLKKEVIKLILKDKNMFNM